MRWCWIVPLLMVTGLGCTDSANKTAADADATATQGGASDDADPAPYLTAFCDIASTTKKLKARPEFPAALRKDLSPTLSYPHVTYAKLRAHAAAKGLKDWRCAAFERRFPPAEHTVADDLKAACKVVEGAEQPPPADNKEALRRLSTGLGKVVHNPLVAEALNAMARLDKDKKWDHLVAFAKQHHVDDFACEAWRKRTQL